MFNISKLAALAALKPYNLTDKDSYKKFLSDLVALVQPLAQKNGVKLDNTYWKHLEFILSNDFLFNYVYTQAFHQLQTKEILFESADENTILELCENAVPNNTESPELISPIVIISVISQIISVINAIKNR